MATKTKSSTKSRKTAPKRVTKRKQTQSDDALNALAKKVRKDPQAVTKAERKRVVEAGLVARGLKGKARQVFIDTGKDSRAQVEPKSKAQRTGGKRNGKVSVNDALKQALTSGPATPDDLIPVVTKLRGAPTGRGVVVSGLRWGLAEERGWYVKGKGDTFRLTAAGKK